MIERNPGAPQPRNDPGAERRRGAWWVAIAALLIWNVFMFWPRPSQQMNLPYSTFLTQVQAGTVSTVTISGDHITGTFTKPISAPNEQPPGSGRRSGAFATTFPATLGDPTLLPLLAAHHVRLDATSAKTPWFVQLFVNWLPSLLLVAFFVWTASTASRGASGMLGRFGRTNARRYASNAPPR